MGNNQIARRFFYDNTLDMMIIIYERHSLYPKRSLSANHLFLLWASDRPHRSEMHYPSNIMF